MTQSIARVAKRTRTLTIWCTEGQIEMLDKLASKHGMNRAQFARKMMGVGLRQLPARSA